MSKTILSLQNISKSFTQGKKNLLILRGASLNIKEGQIVALVGPSGCGKSTLLQIAGLLDQVDSGKVAINGNACTKASDKTLTKLRRDEIGFVYQFHHLMPEFSALENVIIPQIIAGKPKKEAQDNAIEILKFMGLGKRLQHRPSELSGGEQQRVAIARAIVNKPSLLLADEPTGNLDPETADEVFSLLVETTKAIGLSMLIVTHNMELTKRMDKVVTIKDGAIVTKRRK